MPEINKWIFAADVCKTIQEILFFAKDIWPSEGSLALDTMSHDCAILKFQEKQKLRKPA